ncbi:MAG: OB-fold-containig protein [Pseudomonadota bacterium]
MWELITAPETVPFGVSIGLLLVLAALEAVTALSGTGISNALDAVLPEFDGAFETPALNSMLSWLRVGQVPAIILLMVFLLTFGLGGYAVQSLIHHVLGDYLPRAIAIVPALFIALPGVHFIGGALNAVLPRDETEAVSDQSLIGQTATVVIGVARAGSPAQAKLTDAFGTTHYLMVEPPKGQEVASGEAIELQNYENGVYQGAPATPSNPSSQT